MIDRAFRPHCNRTENPCVGGSIPPSATKTKHLHTILSAPRLIKRAVSNIPWIDVWLWCVAASFARVVFSLAVIGLVLAWQCVTGACR